MPRVVAEYAIQDPTVAEVKTITFSRQSNGAGGFVTISSASYALLDENGNVVVTGSVENQLSAAQKTALAGYLNAHVIPDIISEENL